jgi:hypothetical protein
MLSVFLWQFVFSQCFSALLGDNCSLYLGPSQLLGAGRGVFAGRSFEEDEYFDESVSLLVKHEHIENTQLMDYTFASHLDNYSMVLFGLSSFLNSFHKKSVHYHWSTNKFPSMSELSALPFTNSTTTYFQTITMIEEHQEILSYYGESWLEDRNIVPAEYADVRQHSELGKKNEFRTNDNVCLTDVTVFTASNPNIGRGLFAGRNFLRGELVTVSPVLVLSKEIVEITEETSVLKNYCIAADDVPIVLFPLGTVAMINHHNSDSNVEMEWYSWTNGVELRSALNGSAMELCKGSLAPLDLAFRAMRDIQEGEELYLFYGNKWEMSWQHHSFETNCLDDVCKFGSSSFREFIGAPSGLFPSHWKHMSTP